MRGRDRAGCRPFFMPPHGLTFCIAARIYCRFIAAQALSVLCVQAMAIHYNSNDISLPIKSLITATSRCLYAMRAMNACNK